MTSPIELVEAARRGTSEEVERLIEAVWPHAYRLAFTITGERQNAQDAAQEACIILYRRIASLRNAQAFGVWFSRIVTREAIAIARRRPTEKHEPPQALADDRTGAIDVWRAISSLPQNLREVVILRYFEGRSSREIAAILRIPDPTVRFRLMRARQRLRPLLDDSPIASLSNEVRSNAF